MSARLTALLLFALLPAHAVAQQTPAAALPSLVDARSVDSAIRLATAEPIVVRHEVAERLARVARRLATGAVGLKLFAGYRPGMGAHAEGLAVDLTLVDLSRGTEIPMGSTYSASDTTSTSAAIGGREARYRELLKRVMTEEGFVADSARWWHYSLKP